MRNITILEKPVANPHICIGCGVGHNRAYFVDLGIDSSMIIENPNTKLPHYTEGVIYLCSECFLSVFSSFNNKLFEFIKNKEIGRQNQENVEASALAIQLEENKQLKAKLDEMTQKYLEAENKFNEAYKAEQYKAQEDLMTPKTAEEAVTDLLGEDNESGADYSAAANSDSELNDDGGDSESVNSRLESPPAPVITLNG